MLDLPSSRVLLIVSLVDGDESSSVTTNSADQGIGRVDKCCSAHLTSNATTTLYRNEPVSMTASDLALVADAVTTARVLAHVSRLSAVHSARIPPATATPFVVALLPLCARMA